LTQGERIKAIRKELGLTLEKFGEKLGVGKTAISKIEKNERNLTDQMAKAICREYNVDYDYLMYGEGDMFTDLPNTIVDELCMQFDLDDFDRAVVEMYLDLPAELRQVIKAKVKDMVQKVDWDK
jgi:transcriptional regulator with XRE-family HTH domain